MSEADRKAVIAGVAEADEMGRVPDKNVFQMATSATSNAMADAGMEADDIEGLFIQGSGYRERFHFPQVTFAEYLGLEPTFSSSNDMGGSSSYGHIHYAKLAIEAGLIDTALVTYGSTSYSDRRRETVSETIEGPELNRQYEQPYGQVYPMGQYALAARRYMHEYDVTRADLAEIAVSTREWAKRNPKAMMQDDLTVEDVLESDPMCEPLHKLDCCLISDAGGAVVLTAEENVRAGAADPVQIAGISQTHTHDNVSQMPDLTTTGATRTAAAAYDEAGIGPEDVDVAELYDSFTITTALLTEAVGLADPGEATELFAEGETRPGGSIPINTSGGGLSYNHPGTYGILTVIEGVRQVRGTAGDRQVPDVETAITHGTGGALSSHATMVLQEGA